MSVAIDLTTVVPAPPVPPVRPRLRVVPPGERGLVTAAPAGARAATTRLATVHHLRAPAAGERPESVRLTRRGVTVLAGLVSLVGAALVSLAWRSAPPAAEPARSRPAPASVVVHAGDTLWSIATRVAPGVDPRAEVAYLQRRNGIADAGLRPGEHLRVR